MNDSIIKSHSTSNKNFYYLNKKITKLKKSDVKFIKENILDKGQYHLIIKNFSNSPKNMKKNVVNFSKVFGKLIKQDKYGKLIAEITPNVKKIKKKQPNLRYHQTNTGGYIHSDGPQLENPPNYVLMACKKQAKRGGYSILSSIKKIISHLRKYDKKTLQILKKEFLFEKRGFYFKNQPKVFKKPVIQFFNKDFRFRYLRGYMQEAYKIKSIKLTKTQIKALDKLDAMLSQKQNQYRFKLEEGDVLLVNNFKLAHGRSPFSINDNNNRSLIRVWYK